MNIHSNTFSLPFDFDRSFGRCHCFFTPTRNNMKLGLITIHQSQASIQHSHKKTSTSSETRFILFLICILFYALVFQSHVTVHSFLKITVYHPYIYSLYVIRNTVKKERIQIHEK